jgi:hypothetical protein
MSDCYSFLKEFSLVEKARGGQDFLDRLYRVFFRSGLIVQLHFIPERVALQQGCEICVIESKTITMNQYKFSALLLKTSL